MSVYAVDFLAGISKISEKEWVFSVYSENRTH